MLSHRSIIVVFIGLTTLPAMAAEVRSDPSAAEVLKLVVNSYASGLQHLTGQMRDNDSGKEEPFDLTRSAEAVRFRFDNPLQIVSLDLTTSPATLREGNTDKLSKVPAARYGERVRGFDLTY
ncbi:MAG: hypothetical protein JWO08_2002, partial [Verrucomicrobiaceae bacterium]|nr:hypothetical protein [Verrucomicrobiaceae bacterium]